MFSSACSRSINSEQGKHPYVYPASLLASRPDRYVSALTTGTLTVCPTRSTFTRTAKRLSFFSFLVTTAAFPKTVSHVILRSRPQRNAFAAPVTPIV